MAFMTKGYAEDPRDILLSAMFREEYRQMVLVRDIEVYSLCEHHMLPFYGKAHVAYIPDGYITKTTAKVMSLQEPTKKMSKSDENPNASVWILDDKDTIIRKFKRAVTDSDTVVCAREGKDGIINLMSIYSAVTNKSFEEIEAEFAGKGYGDFKTAVGEAVADMLAPMQAEFKRVFADKAYLEDCMKKGSEKAFKASRKTLQKVQKKVGFLTL